MAVRNAPQGDVYKRQLEDTKTGDSVKVTVKRKSIDEYKEIEYQVTIGAR